jgi:hypothetical protein
MPIPHPQKVVSRLVDFQRRVRSVVATSHGKQGNAAVAHASQADTIYAIDADVDPILIDFCNDWSRELPLVLIGEGVVDEAGVEGPRTFPVGTRESDAAVRLIVDPIDGTRGIMYDKRPAWSLAGVAPNRGPATRLRDIEIAVMTELPTSKMGRADVLWAIRGQGAHGVRDDLAGGSSTPIAISPSRSDKLDHGFATVSNFFPGTKVLASELMEYIVERSIGRADVTRATIFDDQYISSGGQFYELIIGHDRFNCDLRPAFYRMNQYGRGLCVHPYDVASFLIAEEAGVVLTDGFGGPLDGPLDTTSDITWAGFANRGLHDRIQPLLIEFFRSRGVI